MFSKDCLSRDGGLVGWRLSDDGVSSSCVRENSDLSATCESMIVLFSLCYS
jgi:hypothetical protein